MRRQREFFILLAVFAIALTATVSKGTVKGKHSLKHDTQLKVAASRQQGKFQVQEFWLRKILTEIKFLDLCFVFFVCIFILKYIILIPIKMATKIKIIIKKKNRKNGKKFSRIDGKSARFAKISRNAAFPS